MNQTANVSQTKQDCWLQKGDQMNAFTKIEDKQERQTRETTRGQCRIQHSECNKRKNERRTKNKRYKRRNKHNGSK